MEQKYQTAKAFRTALEARLKKITVEERVNIQKLRTQVTFDRLLSRLFQSYPEELFLKGGYSMELRIEKARTTKDIDLVLKANNYKNIDKDEIHEKLIESSRIDLNDFFEFRIYESTVDLEALPYGGLRFPVEAYLDARLFVRFPIDVVISSLVLDPVENLKHKNWLEFAGIKSKSYPTISKEQQFAEKLHAYTFPRDENENSRVKDVVDMFLLKFKNMNKNFLKKAIKKVFEYRQTHEVPNYLVEYPENWAQKFNHLKMECEIKEELDECFFAISNFLEWPVIVSQGGEVNQRMTCYFCGQRCFGGSPYKKDLYDYDCKNCGEFRISGPAWEMLNNSGNSRKKEKWRSFLNTRPKYSLKKRFLITRHNLSPKFTKHTLNAEREGFEPSVQE